MALNKRPAAASAPGTSILTWDLIGPAERLLWLNLIMSPAMAAVRNEPAFTGDTLGSSTDKLLFYESRWRFPVGLRIVGDPLSSTVRCNFYRDRLSDDSLIDYLANTGSVRNETSQILVMPGQSIYIQNRTAGIPMTSADILRKLIVDVSALLDTNVWGGLK